MVMTRYWGYYWTLLDTTVDVNIVDEYGEGALHWAESAQGSQHAVKLLLDTGADANRVTKYGWTPRSVALNRNCHLTTITIPPISQGFIATTETSSATPTTGNHTPNLPAQEIQLDVEWTFEVVPFSSRRMESGLVSACLIQLQ